MMRTILLVLFVALLTGCASTYRAPDLPAGGDSAIAILETKNFAPWSSFAISTIDGRPRGLGWHNRFELAPGRRQITAGPTGAHFTGPPVTKYFTAEAGKKYFWEAVRVPSPKGETGFRWTLVIEEQGTGKRVDAIAP